MRFAKFIGILSGKWKFGRYKLQLPGKNLNKECEKQNETNDRNKKLEYTFISLKNVALSSSSTSLS